MTIDQIVKNLENEIKSTNRKDLINKYEEQLIENVEELSKNQNFFNLPLNYIFSVISKINFDEIEECEETIKIVKNFIKNMIKKHSDEKETILILQNLDLRTDSFSCEEIFSFLELTKCPILVGLSDLYKKEKRLPYKDYSYIIHQKDEELDKYKQGIKVIRTTSDGTSFKGDPQDYEPDIFKACAKGQMESVKWLINKRKIKTDTNDAYQNTPIHVASMYGHLDIVQYLKDKSVTAYINAEGFNKLTPLHYACINGHLPIVKYLISQGANIEAKDHDNWTPLHWASACCQKDVVEYLISLGANKYAKEKFGRTPYNLADNDEIRKILK